MKKPPVILKKTYFPKDNFPLVASHNRKLGNTTIGLHAHEFHELVVITQGAGIHITEHENWPISIGDVFVIKGDQVHGYEKSEDLELVNILFDLDRLALQQRDLQGLPGYQALFILEPNWRKRQPFKSRLHLSLQELAQVQVWINVLQDELKARTPGFRLMAKAQFMQIVAFLARRYVRTTPVSHAPIRIAKAIAYLEEHYDRDVYLEQLAGIAHMSKRNILRMFQESTGKSPMAYLIGFRITHAAELLRDGAVNVTEAGYRVGFQDSNYFSRQFRQVMGMSPRQYQRQWCVH